MVPGIKLIKDLAKRIPDGKAGLAVKAVIALVFAAFWNAGPGKDEASDFKANADPDRRASYNRHYAFKGRGRKEFLRSDVKEDVNELVPTVGFASTMT